MRYGLAASARRQKGGTLPRLIFKSNEMAGPPLELKLGLNRLGRSEANDFQIDHPTVSGAHCEIVYLDDAVLVRDRGSTNGTFIDGKLISEARLESGATLRLGEVQLVLEEVLATVAVPRLDHPQPAPTHLPDGSPCCFNHPQARASERCTRCHKCFCEVCIHELHLVRNSASVKCCPACSGKCEPILQAAPAEKKSFLAALGKTLKMTFRRRRKPQIAPKPRARRRR